MSGDDTNEITIIGTGAMGAQIAMVCALAGYDVTAYDPDATALTRGRTELEERMSRDVAKGRATGAEVNAAFQRLAWTADLRSAVASTDFVIEAAVEKVVVKREIFEAIDQAAPHRAILATNSSTIPSSRIADATGRPDRVCNLHFFNPALVMRCVEVVRGPHTAATTVERTIELVRSIGKTPVVLNREISGFIANRILNVVRDEAISLLEGGIASVDDIDTACRTALGYPMGPFELMDLTGIDIGYLAKQARYEESQDPVDLPARSVAEKVDRGELGRKTGKGWYCYDEYGNKIAGVHEGQHR